MPGTMKLTFRGDEEMKANLDKLGEGVRGKVQLAAVLAGALIVVNDGKRRAPILSGTLRRSLHTGGGGAQNGNFVATDEAPELPAPERRGRDLIVAFVGTNLDYGAFNEFGTSRMEARPYMRPAMDENIDEVLDEMAAVIRSFIEKTV